MRKIFTLLFLLTGTISLAQTTYHVKIGGDDTKDGKSWNNAFATIQKALSVATNTGDEIAVAKGTYYPDEGSGFTDNNREHSFYLKTGVDMFGGYEGVEGNYDRDLALNPTILSGEIQQDGNAINNTYNVLRAFSLADALVLDGFTITGGNANTIFVGASDGGGGLRNVASNISVINCSFLNNSGLKYGGAVLNLQSNSTFYRCIFTGNAAPKGGAIYNTNNSLGGNSSPTIGNCSFSDNTGAAIYNFGNGGNASSTISNCNFTNNDNVAIFNFGEETGISGGTASPSIFNCMFVGPAIHNAVKSLFNSNGGIASPAVYNCSFLSETYSAVHNEGTDGIVNPTFINCIIWGSISNRNATPTISYSILKGSFAVSLGSIDGGHNLDADPQFVDSANGNLRLQTCSPAIDAGNTAVLKVSPDLGGNNRVINSIIDMGAYETPAGTDIYPPVVKTKNITLGLGANGLASIIAINVNDGSTDNCGILSMSVSPSSFNCSNVGPNTVTLTVNDINGNTATGQATVTIVDNIVPNALCKNITVQSDANGNATITAAQIDNGSTDICGIASRTLNKTTFTCADVGANVVTLTVTDNNGNTATCTATVTIEDMVAPVALCRNIDVELDANGNATITPAQIDNGSNDACGIKSLGLNKTTFDCTNVGANEVTLTVTDNNNNVSTCTATITVEDNMAPVISGISATPEVLSPPNHQMKAVFINYTSTDNCPGTVCVISNIASNEPVDGTGDGNTSPDWEYVDASHVRLRAERSANGSGRIYTITITCTDASGNTSTATQQVRVTHNIKNPHSGQALKIGSTVNFSGEFWDKPGNTHTGKWLIDGSSAKATVTEPTVNKNGTVTGGYKFGTAGVFKLQMNVTDQKGITNYANTNGDLDAIVVIYDPNGGHTYGGGYYNSPAGALISTPDATGKASYGFAVNYTNAAKPKGETQFEFKVGDFEFNALNFDYLVISNSMAQIKGTGKIIGGQSGIGFTMTVVDGELDGTGVDKIRMKIYNKHNGKIIYDNQPGAGDADNPVTAVGNNSIIFIQGNAANNQAAKKSATIVQGKVPEKILVEGLEVSAHPNPSSSNFIIMIRSNNEKEKIMLQVYDVNGRMIEVRSNIISGSAVRFGDLYRPGSYYIRVMQGKEHKEIKLIKLSN